MASPRFLASLLFASLFFFHSALATLYVVGGHAGWTLPSRAKLDYEQWSSSITFKIGDSLEFDYSAKAHSVLQVIRSDYRYCNTTNPIASFQDGKTIIELSKPGSYYFIDGVGDHCKEGQKFQLKIVDGTAVPSSPAAAALAPVLAPAPEPSVQAVPPAATGGASALRTSVAMGVSILTVVVLKWM